MSARYVLCLLVCLLQIPLASWAQTRLDIIPLQHRTHDQILPALRPLVGDDAALSGMNNRIFIRADAATRTAVKQAIEAMDTPLRSLMIRKRLTPSVILSAWLSWVSRSGVPWNWIRW